MSSKGFIDRIVEVRFVQISSRLAAVSAEFEKIAFLDRFCHIRVMPQIGEEWQCIVRGDSNRQDPKRGALFLKPIRRLEEEETWCLEDQPEAHVLNVYKPLVRKTVAVGKREIGRQVWCPSGRGDIQEDWPKHIQTLVSLRFGELDKAVRSVVYGAMRKELAELKKSVPRFKEFVDITVEKFERISHELSLQKELGARQAVYADGKRLGLLDRWSSAPASSFPFVIEGLNIYLSNGTKLTVHDRALGVILSWENGRPKTAKAFSSSIDCAVGDRTVLNWGDALDLKEGSHFARDYKFQWVGNWLTNGIVWLPRERPCGSEWRDYTIPAIPEEYWSLFVDRFIAQFG